MELLIGLVFFALIMLKYATGSKEGRDRYYELENKRRYGGKKLSPEDHAEWSELCKKFKW